MQYVYSIGYSKAVSHPSANTTQCCLTSVIGRELVGQAFVSPVKRDCSILLIHTSCRSESSFNWLGRLDKSGEEIQALSTFPRCHQFWNLSNPSYRNVWQHCDDSKMSTALGCLTGIKTQCCGQQNVHSIGLSHRNKVCQFYVTAYLP